jgi:hypothetical protein
MIEDLGEQYDGEKEGGDLRNEQSYKRPAEAGLSPDAKKVKNEESTAEALNTADEPMES